MKPWKPRSSSIGNYMRCEYRAVQDRLIYEGKIPKPVSTSRGTSYASLGNCGHFTLQDGMRCVFAPKHFTPDFDRLLADPAPTLSEDEEDFLKYADEFFDGDLDATFAAYQIGDPKIYQPLAEEWTDAALLFGKDTEMTRQKVRDTATLAAAKVPKTPDGKPWICETTLENDYLTGHTDFLSDDFTMVGDLKTASRPPQGGWIKYEHLAQLAAYHLLTGCKQTWILYVDSQKQAWATLIWTDWTQPGKKEYAEHVASYSRYLMSDQVIENAIPRLGDHCGGSWCGHQRTCYQEYMPRPGIMYDAKQAAQPTGQLMWGGKAMGG